MVLYYYKKQFFLCCKKRCFVFSLRGIETVNESCLFVFKLNIISKSEKCSVVFQNNDNKVVF